MMSAKPKLRTVSGLPPLSYKAKKAGTLSNYRIYGNTVSGESVGDRTGNLFDETIYNKNVADSTLIYVPIYVGNVDYVTCSTTCPKTISGDYDSYNPRYIFILSGNVDTGVRNETHGVSNGAPRTIQPLNGYVTIAYRKIESNNVRPWEYQTLLNYGSTALPYEPYGYRVAVTAGGVNIFDENYEGLNTRTYYRPLYVGDGTFTLSTNAPKNSSDTTNLYLIAGAVSTGASYVNNGVSLNSPRTVTSVDGYVTVAYRISGGIDPSDYHAMLNKGSSALPYEPYSEPVTTNIYLPEQISKVGNVTEYIDYREQKQYFADGTSADVTLPALPTLPGTNTLSVGTTVQPSAVEVTGRIKSAE